MKSPCFSVIAGIILAVVFSGPMYGQPDPVKLTVYNQGMALVRERRTIHLETGTGPVKIEDVPALIEPTSVYFKANSHPDEVKVLEQNYEYDLVSPGKLWDKFLGKEVEIESTDPETRKTVRRPARLLSTGWTFENGGWSQTGTPIVEMDGKVYVQPPGAIVLPAVSASAFLLRPTLNWLVKSPFSGEESVDLSYITNGLSWSADYVAVTDPSDTQLDLTGWVTLTNTSGTVFRDASLQLMAGNVHLVQPAGTGYAAPRAAMAYNAAADAQFQEKPFFEYHLYTLGRPATIRNDETKQIELLSGRGVPAQKIFVYDGAPSVYYYDVSDFRENPSYGNPSNKKVWVMLEFLNSEKNGLGIPLPAGKIRVYKTDTDGSRQFVGEDSIDHTPKGEKVRLHLGDAFDVVGERKQTAFTQIIQHHVYDESFRIDLRNHKDSAVAVRVVEHLWRGTDWTVTQSSRDYRKIDSRTIEFTVPVAAGGSEAVAYTVRYKW